MRVLDYLWLPAELTEFERGYLAKMNRVALGFFWLNLPLFVAVAFFNGTGPGLALVLTGLVLAGVGVAVGAVGAISLAGWLDSVLFGVAPRDPATFVGAIAVIALVAVLASLIPALRAARVDPAEALRG